MVKRCFDEKENLPYNLKYEINGITRTFLNRGKQICQAKKNQEFHKTLWNIKNKTDIKVVKYDKGNGVCLMSKVYYLK